MTKELKTYLVYSIIATLAVFSLSAIVYVASFAKASQPSSYRSFSVSGEGTVTVSPDIAQFSFGVTTQGGLNLGALQSQNAQDVNAAIAFVKEQGVEDKDITTKGYYVEPRYQYYSCSNGSNVCPPPDITGYTVSQQVQVKVRDFTKLTGLLSGVVVNGANNVSQLSFTVEDRTQVQNTAREEAVQKAQEKAQAIAEATGFSIGKLLSIEEGGASVPPYYFAETADGRGGIGGAVSTIEPGSQDVTVTVTLQYEIR